MNQDLAEMALEDDIAGNDEAAPETVPVPRSLVPHLSETAILLDIDGTLLDLMPTPREVWVPPGLAKTLNRLLARTNGALALVSGRSLNDIDLIFAPEQFPAVGGHGAEPRQLLVHRRHRRGGERPGLVLQPIRPRKMRLGTPLHHVQTIAPTSSA